MLLAHLGKEPREYPEKYPKYDSRKPCDIEVERIFFTPKLGKRTRI